MSTPTPPNVKIFDRPEKKGPSPLLMAIIALLVLAGSIFGYRALVHPAAAPTAPATRATQSSRLYSAPLPPRIFTGFTVGKG